MSMLQQKSTEPPTLLSASSGALRRIWKQQKLSGHFPEHLPLHYLRKWVYYQIQEKECGGLNPMLQKQLLGKRAGVSESSVSRKATTRSGLAAGTLLKRSWQGRIYEVTVLEKGFLYHGQTYRSLSAVAKSITGAHWSGPLFFGLKKQVRTKIHLTNPHIQDKGGTAFIAAPPLKASGDVQ